MFYNIKIPQNFITIQNNPYIIEIKSEYHYWKLMDTDRSIILAHKYKKNDHYHKQFTCDDPNYAIRYIMRHDKYFESKVSAKI